MLKLFVVKYLFLHLIQHLFIEYKFCARHCSKPRHPSPIPNCFSKAVRICFYFVFINAVVPRKDQFLDSVSVHLSEAATNVSLILAVWRERNKEWKSLPMVLSYEPRWPSNGDNPWQLPASGPLPGHSHWLCVRVLSLL